MDVCAWVRAKAEQGGWGREADVYAYSTGALSEVIASMLRDPENVERTRQELQDFLGLGHGDMQ